MPRIHRTSVLLFGKYSRMLDMGGMGTAESKHQVLDMGKNNKVRMYGWMYVLMCWG